MALKEVQHFLTQYIRDSRFRETVAGSGIASVAAHYNLNGDDQKLLEEMELSYVAREAEGVLVERLEKREGEFREFFDHLANYTSIEHFFRLYDQAYSKGLMTRPVEMDCFLSFATGFVVENQLPPYLVDLARFNYHYTQISITPIENGEAGGLRPDEELRLYHLVQLKSPYRIVNFRYDIPGILRSEFDFNNPLYFQEAPISLFIQKDWDKPTTTQIHYAGDVPLLNELTRGETSVNELLACYGVQQYGQVLNMLSSLYQRNIISVKLPKHFL
ncbi:MAG TPA: hypothetical protein VGB46_02745 [Flavisolibacter sp.]|jgi:hypothetical protein